MKSSVLHITALFFFAAFFWMQNASAQTIHHELGLRFGGVDNFDFVYKKEKAPGKLIRYRLAATNINFNRIPGDNRLNANLGFRIGWESRKSIGKKVHFIHGPEPGINIGISTLSNNFSSNISPIIGYVLGFQLDLSESFYVNVETVPSLQGNFTVAEGVGVSDSFSINAGFNSSIVAITIAYRFEDQ
jgi:hypothetical protein